MARECGARAGGTLLQLAYCCAGMAGCSRNAATGLGSIGIVTSTTGLHVLARQAARGIIKQGFASAPQQAEVLPRQPTLYRRLKALIHDYKKLSKFRLSALVALTASAGFAAGSGEVIDYAQLAWTSLGTLGAAACANTLNQLYEVSNDARMTRTANRPLPAGRLSLLHARLFALLSGAAGVWILADKTNTLTTTLGVGNILLYAGIYTPLKQLSIANTWVGAVVGAIPPLMGWAAAAGDLEPGAWVLAAALFSWQMPHFLALAWLCKDDYQRGGFKMLPSVDPSGRRTAAVALRHTAFLLSLGVVAAALQVTSQWFAPEAAVLAGAMGVGALSFRSNPTATGARNLFRGSLLYLPLLLAGFVAHRQPNTNEVSWQAVQQEAAGQLRQLGKHLPEALQPGQVWQQLQQLQWPQNRALEERYPMVAELQQQLQSIRCPSRAYGDTVTDTEGLAEAPAAASTAVAAAEVEE